MLLRPTSGGCRLAASCTTRRLRQPACISRTPQASAAGKQMAGGSSRLIFYDISSPQQPRSYAPNPSKSRYALSFKAVPFTTTWVDLLDITDVRKGLLCPPVRKLHDGSDFYTLPMLQDPTTGVVIGDSFDIANYLEDTFPDSGGCLFPADCARIGLDYESPFKDTPLIAPLTSIRGDKNTDYARFNMHVDATFTAYVVLVCHYLPFNPGSAAAVRDVFVKRAGVNSWDDFNVQGEAREQMKGAFKESLTSLAQPFLVNGDGPYLEGDRATYADLIVGGWLNMYAATMPQEEWEEFRGWHNGVFGRLHDALQQSYFECT